MIQFGIVMTDKSVAPSTEGTGVVHAVICKSLSDFLICLPKGCPETLRLGQHSRNEHPVGQIQLRTLSLQYSHPCSELAKLVSCVSFSVRGGR